MLTKDLVQMRTCIYIVLRFNLGNIEMIMDRNTLFLTLTWLLLFLAFSSALVKKGIETDESALLALKSHITWDSNSTHLMSNWTEGTLVCSWIGVGCSPLHNRVVSLDLFHLGLHGTIPPQLGNLSFLTSINISSNNFQGQLPQEMANLRRLKYMDFRVNNIGGDVPGWLGSLSNLRHLDLGNNTLSGALPSSLFNATKLEYVRLDSNHLIGHIPEEVGNLRNLWHFNVQYNQVEGSLPLSFFNLSSLQIMAFTDNRLNGGLPLDICSNLPKLRGIYLSLNQFSGSIQSRFDNCSKLQALSLSFNNFTGPLPKEMGNLTELAELYFGYNRFQGGIPSEFGNLRNLEVLSFLNCSLSGQIPNEISNYERLKFLDFGFNFLSGPIPESIFNITSLSIISLAGNNLTGSLPRDIGIKLPNIRELILAYNRLSGVVPDSISNLTNLINLALSDNQFTGPFPSSLENLRYLIYLYMDQNFLTSESSTKMGFLESMTNCRYLERVDISYNPLNIPLLPTMGNFSSSLAYFAAVSCGIKGTIPHELGNLNGLFYLSIEDNNLTGHIPPTIQKLYNLQALGLQGNQITGLIPNSLCTMRNLTLLYLGRNQIHGQVPKCFGNLTSLTYLYLDSNRLDSTLPIEIGNLRNLLELDVHSNYLSGNINPSIGGLSAALSIDLSKNNFSGDIPPAIQGLGNLINLSLAHNHLQGPISGTFKNMLSLEVLDLSHNNLTGEIPATLGTLSTLKYLNVSFNHFSGRVPSNGSFVNFGSDSFISNDALCGGPPHLHFPLCITDSLKKGSHRKKLRVVAYILIPIAALVSVISAILFVFTRKQMKPGTLSQVELSLPTMLERVSYYEILRATNGFNESNLLGTGSFGSVFKGILRDGTVLAIKVFNLQLEGAYKSFETECEIITNIRHKNLLKVISSCSNLDFKALILEYMPNGSLQRWLYSHNCFLDFLQRLNIMIDVASALDYLHHGNILPIVHCDIKPSNVLLDEEMNGHVSDFGISKLLGEDEIMVRTMTLATIGYTAPEYGSEGIVSTRCDIYSFGILLMETFTRRKPTDDMFGEGYGLREMIKDNLQNLETEFIDQNLIHARDQESNKMVKCIVRLMDLALRCAMDSPEQRADVSDVLVELHKIKLLFLSRSA